jgi:hypothetical protein
MSNDKADILPLNPSSKLVIHDKVHDTSKTADTNKTEDKSKTTDTNKALEDKLLYFCFP